jgi:hypothetical protein
MSHTSQLFERRKREQSASNVRNTTQPFPFVSSCHLSSASSQPTSSVPTVMPHSVDCRRRPTQYLGQHLVQLNQLYTALFCYVLYYTYCTSWYSRFIRLGYWQASRIILEAPGQGSKQWDSTYFNMILLNIMKQNLSWMMITCMHE